MTGAEANRETSRAIVAGERRMVQPLRGAEESGRSAARLAEI